MPLLWLIAIAVALALGGALAALTVVLFAIVCEAVRREGL